MMLIRKLTAGFIIYIVLIFSWLQETCVAEGDFTTPVAGEEGEDGEEGGVTDIGSGTFILTTYH